MGGHLWVGGGGGRSDFIFIGKPQKRDHDNFCLHLWELWMPHLKHLFHCYRQKRHNISAIKMLHQMSVWVVVVALIGLVLIYGQGDLSEWKSQPTQLFTRFKIGGSLVGVWNGWGYGIAIFRALNFQISEPEIWQKSLFLRNFRDFPGKFGLWKIFFGLWKMAIPYATNPYPH